MKLNINKAFSKSALRHVYVGVGFVIAAAETYFKKGNEIGLNLATLYGIAAQAGIALSAVLQRYFDKTDPQLGAATDVVVATVDKKLEPFTEPKPVA